MGGRAIAGAGGERGTGIEVGNIKIGGGTQILNNIVAHDYAAGAQPAINLTLDHLDTTQGDNASDDVGIIALVKPLGAYMARVYEGKSLFGLDRIFGPIERLVYAVLDQRSAQHYGRRSTNVIASDSPAASSHRVALLGRRSLLTLLH